MDSVKPIDMVGNLAGGFVFTGLALHATYARRSPAIPPQAAE